MGRQENPDARNIPRNDHFAAPGVNFYLAKLRQSRSEGKNTLRQAFSSSITIRFEVGARPGLA
jgi:hypothetical protein